MSEIADLPKRRKRAKPTTVRQHVAAEVRAEMARKGYTQGDIAAVLGVSQGAVSRRFTCETAFDVDELSAVAALLEVSPEKFFVGAPGGRPGRRTNSG